MKTDFKTALFLVAFFILNTITIPLSAATITSVAAGGTWNVTGTWVGGVVPDSTSDVIIANGATVTVTASAKCKSVSFDNTASSGSGTLSINSGCTLTVTGGIFVPGYSTAVKITGTYYLSGSGTIACDSLDIGNPTNPGGSGSTVVTVISTVSTLNVNYNINLIAKYNSGGNKTNNPVFEFQSGSLTVNGSITTSNENAANTCTFTMATGTAGGTLILNGATPWSLAGTGTNTINLAGTSTEVRYNRNGDQVVLAGTYTNLTLGGSGNKSMNGVTVNKKFVKSGSVTTTGTPTCGATASIEYNGSNAITTSTELPTQISKLVINNTGGVTLGSALQVDSIIIGNITSNSIFLDGGKTITSTGYLNIANRSTYNCATATFPSFSTRLVTGGTVNYSLAGNQTVTSGTYGNLVLSGSGNKSISSVTVNDTIFVGGTAVVVGVPTYGASIVLVENGSSDQTTGDELVSSMPTIVINNPQTVRLNRSVSISNTVKLSQGYLNTNGFTLTLGNNATLTGETTNQYVIGSLIKTETVGTSASSSLNSIGISFSAGTDNLGTVSVTRVSGTAPTGGGVLTHKLKRSWYITSTNPPTNGRNITFTWISNDDNNVDLTSARICKLGDGSPDWITYGSAVDASSRTITATGVTSFSLWTISDTVVPLPVELTSFTTDVVKTEVTLNWHTMTEVNNYGFEIERRMASVSSWEKVGFVSGYGTSNSPHQYSYSEAGLSSGRYIYRLKQVDNNGVFKYSASVEAEVTSEPITIGLSQNYPNPFNPSTKISFAAANTGRATVVVYNVLGQQVRTLFDGIAEGRKEYTITFDATQLSSGIYFCKMWTATKTEIRRMILLK